jgi:GMP synthase-like glutamine amidotransferase
MKPPEILVLDHYPKSHPIYGKMGARPGEIKARQREELQVFLHLLFGGREIDITTCEPEFDSPEKLQMILRKKWELILLSGSPHNIDEGHAWMEREQQMLREMIQNRTDSRLLGICAGHQIIHQAMSGTVKHVDEPYNLGKTPWLDINGKPGEIHRSHKYHVTEPAPRFDILSRFQPDNDRRNGIVNETTLQDPNGGRIVTLQGHPEKNPSQENVQRIQRLLELGRQHY